MGPWPFKTLKQNSTWPLQPFVVQFAAGVLSVPKEERRKAAVKMIERCIRMGARLAVEFELPAPLFVEIAKAMIVKEGGAEAQHALAEAFGDDVVKVLDGADESLEEFASQIVEIFSKGMETPEA
jgi:hypothetical protein